MLNIIFENKYTSKGFHFSVKIGRAMLYMILHIVHCMLHYFQIQSMQHFLISFMHVGKKIRTWFKMIIKGPLILLVYEVLV